MRVWIINLVLVILLSSLSISACSPGQLLGPTVTPTQTSTSTATITPTPTVTPTPIPPPTIDVGLSEINAASMSIENGTWVVKNADGQVTATWNEQKNEWIYDMGAITIVQSVAGYKSEDPSVYSEILSRPLPPDDPSLHFINPDTNEPMGFGTWKEGILDFIHYTRGLMKIPYTYVSVRLRGLVPVDDRQVILFSVPIGLDKEAVFAYGVPSEHDDYGIDFITNDKLTYMDPNHSSQKRIKLSESYELFNDTLFGRQVIIEIDHYPLLFPPYPIDYMRKVESATTTTIAFLNGSTKKPTIVLTQSGYPMGIPSNFLILKTESK